MFLQSVWNFCPTFEIKIVQKLNIWNKTAELFSASNVYPCGKAQR